ncbi:MAG TPA: 3-oxoacyl-ACP reductase FabG [Clostridiales bacterium]|nr:3-oxoacyl-ACP reductase FabG [Clostridiales bacterium]
MVKKTVLITGASRGIGSACAKVFAREGYNIILNFLSSESEALELAGELSKKGTEVLPFRADVSDFKQVKEMVEAGQRRFGKIDALICNAGISQQKLFTDITPEEWHRMMSVTVDAAFYCCQAVLPGMIRRQKGKIVLVSSIWGMVGASCEVHYSTAKAALIGLTKSLAKELGPSNINVNCVAPGIIETDMNSSLDSETREVLAQETPLGRFGTPWEIAEAVYFLASEKSDFITGQILSPNGGFVI